jgi:hypothetical protein
MSTMEMAKTVGWAVLVGVLIAVITAFASAALGVRGVAPGGVTGAVVGGVMAYRLQSQRRAREASRDPNASYPL